MAYASKTKVAVNRSRAEIEDLLVRRRATRIGVMFEAKHASVLFDMADRRVRFTITFPDGTSAKDDQARRTRWRALLLCIKAKLESVDAGIETFEEAFLAHVVVGGVGPDGPTVYERIRGQMAQISSGKHAPLLLAGPETKRE